MGEKLYHSLVETMNEGLGLIDENGITLFIYDQSAKLLGLEKSAIIGWQWMSFYSDNAIKEIKCQLEKRQKGNFSPYEVMNIRKDGRTVYMRISPKPVSDDNGNFKGSMALFQDITESKKND